MKAGELKADIDNSRRAMGTEIIQYFNEYHSFLDRNNLSRCCLATLFFCVNETLRIVDFNGTRLLLKEDKASSYQLMGLPLTDDLIKARDIVSLCIELGIGLDLSDSDLHKLKLNTSPDVFMDSYLYDYESMMGYFKGCSRSTRKNINRFEKDYTMSVFKSNCVSGRVMHGIYNVNDVWLKEMKNDNPLYTHMIDKTTQCLNSHLINLIQSAVIAYSDKDDNLVAYDYFEVWGDTVYALGGKSVIKDLSAFKVVNRNVMQVANDLFGATKMDIGYSNVFSAKSKKPMEHAINLSEAKSSFPNVTSMYSMFYSNSSKYKKAISIDNSSNTLF